jgi:hypothetical protein
MILMVVQVSYNLSYEHVLWAPEKACSGLDDSAGIESIVIAM